MIATVSYVVDVEAWVGNDGRRVQLHYRFVGHEPSMLCASPDAMIRLGKMLIAEAEFVKQKLAETSK